MPFFKFTALRLGLVVVFFVISYWLGLGAIFSAIVAAVLAWCVTYLFFRPMRDAASASLQRRFRDGAPPQRNFAELDDAAAEDVYDPNTSVNPDRKPRS
ncbi:DUF4229 domain-containing protein [Arthrobacter sp. H20]|uniref:DUF4229 domain-containing protein n=1 Tax=Arthrobacter sp. H20 TaxID=1267981 RepID=UPI000478AA1C|nr:DUF4229 domain-containing protein [Arthrobacter sp. H20]